MSVVGAHEIQWLATAAAVLPAIAITWRASEAERDTAAFRALTRRLRKMVHGRTHTSTERVQIAGRIGQRSTSIEFTAIQSEIRMAIRIACGSSPALQILPNFSRPPAGVQPYADPAISVSRLHNIWTDDASAVRKLLDSDDLLRLIRQLCVHRKNSLTITNGTAEFQGLIPGGENKADEIRSVIRKLEAIAGAFEREPVRRPRSQNREIVAIFLAVACAIALAAVVASNLRKSASPTQAAEKNIHHFPVDAPSGWRGITTADFSPDDLDWFRSHDQKPGRVLYIDLDGSGEEAGTVQILRSGSDGAFRVICYNRGKVLSDNQYPNIAFLLKVSMSDLRRAKWKGPSPAKIGDTGEALIVVTERQDVSSAIVYRLEDGAIQSYRPVDFRFL